MLKFFTGTECHGLVLADIINATRWIILDEMRLLSGFPKVMQAICKIQPYQSCYLVSV
jgi:hypothetical protein